MNKVSPPPLPAAERKRKGLRLLAKLLIFFLFLGLSWASYIIYLSSVESKLRAQCRQRNEPLTWNEVINAYPEIKEEDNAAAALLELWQEDEPGFAERYQAGPAAQKFLPNDPPIELGQITDWLNGQTVTDEQWTLLTDYLGPLEHRREKLFAAVSRPDCQFPTILQDGYAAQMPHAVMIKQEATRLAFDTMQSTQSNRVDRAVTNIIAMFSLSRHMASEPLTISQLISCSIYAQAAKSLCYLLSRHELTEAQLAELRQACTWYSPQVALSKSIMAERVTMLSLYSMSTAEIAKTVELKPDEQAGYGIAMVMAKVVGVRQADCINIMRVLREADSVTASLSPETIPQWDNIFAKKPWGFPPQMYSHNLLPALSGLIYRHLDAQATQRSLLAALAVETHWAKTKKLPDSMKEIRTLAGDLSLDDPYVKGPLHYKKLESGYVIYSVGRDRADNGGQTYGTKGMRYPNGDVVFSVGR